MKLSEKQQLFALILSEFIIWINQNPGYAVTIGEVWRSEATAAQYAKEGRGVEDSYHRSKLAADLNLFINGIYQTTTESHAELGRHWKTLHSACVWGGDFKKEDGNHYSMWEGV